MGKLLFFFCRMMIDEIIFCYNNYNLGLHAGLEERKWVMLKTLH